MINEQIYQLLRFISVNSFFFIVHVFVLIARLTDVCLKRTGIMVWILHRSSRDATWWKLIFEYDFFFQQDNCLRRFFSLKIQVNVLKSLNRVRLFHLKLIQESLQWLPDFNTALVMSDNRLSNNRKQTSKSVLLTIANSSSSSSGWGQSSSAK